MHNRRLLWVGDACVSSGFAKATHYTLDVLKDSWDITVLGINCDGGPEVKNYPYDIYPAGRSYGLEKFIWMVNKVRPDLIIVQQDHWNFPGYVRRAGNVPIIGAVAVDGKNVDGTRLNGLMGAIFWTEFARKEANLGGYTGPSAVVPLGVDTSVFYPMNRVEARQKLSWFPRALDNAFIVGNVNRNQPRKRLDLTIKYFANWIKSRDIRDAYIYLHVCPTGDQGIDVNQMLKYYDVAKKSIVIEPEIGHGDPQSEVAITMNAFNVMMTTSENEGWGLPAIEGMACGVPQILPDWAAYSDWATEAGIMVPCYQTSCTPKVNVLGGVPDEESTISALDRCYRDKEFLKEKANLSHELALRPQYRWENIGKKFAEEIDNIRGYQVKPKPEVVAYVEA